MVESRCFVLVIWCGLIRYCIIGRLNARWERILLLCGKPQPPLLTAAIMCVCLCGCGPKKQPLTQHVGGVLFIRCINFGKHLARYTRFCVRLNIWKTDSILRSPYGSSTLTTTLHSKSNGAHGVVFSIVL